MTLAPTRRDLRLGPDRATPDRAEVRRGRRAVRGDRQADPNNPDVLREWGGCSSATRRRPEAERKQAASAVWRRLVDARPDDPATMVAGRRPVPLRPSSSTRPSPSTRRRSRKARLAPVCRVPRRVLPQAQATRRGPGDLVEDGRGEPIATPGPSAGSARSSPASATRPRPSPPPPRPPGSTATTSTLQLRLADLLHAAERSTTRRPARDRREGRDRRGAARGGPRPPDQERPGRRERSGRHGSGAAKRRWSPNAEKATPRLAASWPAT